MKSRLLTLCLGLLLVATMLAACGAPTATSTLVPQTPESMPSEGALLRLLRFVPDAPLYREYLTFGDAAAWHTSWGIPRIDDKDELGNLDREPNAYWKFILPRQTTPPQCLGTNYLLAEDQRSVYGFDLFNLDRYLEVGNPPDQISVVALYRHDEFGFDGTQVADALTSSGYKVEELDGESRLYSVREDYEVDLKSPTRTGQLGELNRIALLDGQMVIARATENVTNALLARSGDLPSLADDPSYVAATKALEDQALAGTGELVGVILTGVPYLADPTWYVMPGTPEEIRGQLEEYAQGPQLPVYNLVAFATRHTKGASYLILAVVFPEDTDANAAADILADRLQSYVSIVRRQPLDDRWAFEMATGIQAEGLPVALVVMRADDPPPTPEDAFLVNAAVISWIEMVVARDTMFLMSGQSGE